MATAQAEKTWDYGTALAGAIVRLNQELSATIQARQELAEGYRQHAENYIPAAVQKQLAAAKDRERVLRAKIEAAKRGWWLSDIADMNEGLGENGRIRNEAARRGRLKRL
jgi:hypothetical protein